ncbi:retrotransposon protein [Cucumis melo var. makuwa]|uniref:Retrotransposon protein n=1 Tax=Cucumis melo var. makuwa TaxID=1194695 RepID=A0A5A7UV40_CUCMM|nr:retrotransposon protein [Cucumis melo var. makuwa]TYK10398.1 retrotransposon protein [Cucumis melo var. makuwa]
MFSCLSSFHSSFSSPQPFFTDTSVDLFPLAESTPDNELAQSAPTSATSNQSSVFDDSPEPTIDIPPRDRGSYGQRKLDESNSNSNSSRGREDNIIRGQVEKDQIMIGGMTKDSLNVIIVINLAIILGNAEIESKKMQNMLKMMKKAVIPHCF